jgi:lipopolysaccharide export system ATP-binding protein
MGHGNGLSGGRLLELNQDVRGKGVLNLLAFFRQRRPPPRRPNSGNGRWPDAQRAAPGRNGPLAGHGAKQAPAQRMGREQPAARREPQQGYLAAHSLQKSYGGRMVVNGVSLYVRRGEAVGLLGPNGAGKTTAFYTITGLIKATAEDRARRSRCNAPSDVPAGAIGHWLSSPGSTIFAASTSRTTSARCWSGRAQSSPPRSDLRALLDEFEIARHRKTPSIALSGGERRRVEIARALASRPSYMLLDEPFAGIDPKAVVEIQRLVRRLTTRGIGVLITDHNVRETLALTDRSYIIYSGQVLMEGRKDDIVNDPEVRRLYLGEDFQA